MTADIERQLRKQGVKLPGKQGKARTKGAERHKDTPKPPASLSAPENEPPAEWTPHPTERYLYGSIALAGRCPTHKDQLPDTGRITLEVPKEAYPALFASIRGIVEAYCSTLKH